METSPNVRRTNFDENHIILFGTTFTPRLIMLCICILNLLLVIIWLTTASRNQWTRSYSQPIKSPRNQEATVTPETIHILMTANGMITFQRVVNTLKSMLYYQNRVRHGMAGCLINITNATVLPCPRNLTFSSSSNRTMIQPIHLHLISDEMTQNLLTFVLKQWNLTNFNWTVYPMEQHKYNVDWIPNSHGAGVSAMIKLTLTNILPDTVEKVLSIDTDMLFNHNLAELWDHFNRFNDQQIFGFAWEMNSDVLKCEEPITQVIPAKGINGGLALLHLKRMRERDWDNIWNSTLNNILREVPELIEGEQQVFRTVIRAHPHYYYKLPCEWNVQVYADVASDCCHVIWPLRHPDQFDCWPTIGAHRTFRPVKLAHFDTNPKPGDTERKVDSPGNLTQIERKMTTNEIRNRFIFTYYAFAKMPLTCFY